MEVCFFWFEFVVFLGISMVFGVFSINLRDFGALGLPVFFSSWMDFLMDRATLQGIVTK